MAKMTKEIRWLVLFLMVSCIRQLFAESLDLQITKNNPFKPSAGQTVEFKFKSLDTDRTLNLRVYTLSGELVKEWPAEVVSKGTDKVITWNGKNSDGRIVTRGVYLVNLSDTNDNKNITKKVFVVSK